MIFDGSHVEGRELLAPLSKDLCVPPSSTFEPLNAEPHEVPLSTTGTGFFSSHASFLLPCDHQCAATRGRRTLGKADCIHKFLVHMSLAEPINNALAQWSVQRAFKEQDTNAKKSNWGGFQSLDDAFVAECHPGVGCIVELHRISSAAIDEVCNRATRDAAGGQLCEGVAWVNVNRPTDLNFLHVHEPTHWSGVYFVRAGAAPPQDAPANAGHLVFRGGGQQNREGLEDYEPASHTYFAVPPSPGSLWLFPGTVPHCVIPIQPGAGQEELEAAAAKHAAGDEPTALDPATVRISIAINFNDDAPPPR